VYVFFVRSFRLELRQNWGIMKKLVYVLRNINLFSAFKWFVLKYLTSKKTNTFKVLEHDMVLDLRTGGISRALALYGSREVDMLEIVRDIINPGMHVFDLGANIGFYTLEMNRLLKGSGKLLAVEPDPRNLPVLKLNLNKLKYKDSVSLFEGAVGKEDGSGFVSMASKSNLTTISGIKQDELASEVRLKSIKSLTEEFLDGKVNMVRMDIEGFEVEVLGGAIDFFAKQTSCNILVELHPNTYNDEHSLNNVLANFFNNGFSVSKAVCTNIGMEILKKKNIKCHKEIFSDGFQRYMYENLSDNNVLHLAHHQPKAIRYILLSK